MASVKQLSGFILLSCLALLGKSLRPHLPVATAKINAIWVVESFIRVKNNNVNRLTASGRRESPLTQQKNGKWRENRTKTARFSRLATVMIEESGWPEKKAHNSYLGGRVETIQLFRESVFVVINLHNLFKFAVMASFESPCRRSPRVQFLFVAAVASFGRANFSMWHYGSVRLRSLSILNIRESLMLTFENKTKVRPRETHSKVLRNQTSLKMRFFSFLVI